MKKSILMNKLAKFYGLCHYKPRIDLRGGAAWYGGGLQGGWGEVLLRVLVAGCIGRQSFVR